MVLTVLHSGRPRIAAPGHDGKVARHEFPVRSVGRPGTSHQRRKPGPNSASRASVICYLRFQRAVFLLDIGLDLGPSAGLPLFARLLLLPAPQGVLDGVLATGENFEFYLPLVHARPSGVARVQGRRVLEELPSSMAVMMSGTGTRW